MHFFSKPGSAYCLNALKVKVFFESSAAGIRTTTVVVRTTTRMWPESLNDFNFFFCSATVGILCLLSSTFFENRFRLVVACKFSWIFHFQGNGGGGLHPLKWGGPTGSRSRVRGPTIFPTQNGLMLPSTVAVIWDKKGPFLKKTPTTCSTRYFLGDMPVHLD